MSAAGRMVCRSCGAPHPGHDVCPSCHVSTARPSAGGDRVGMVVRQSGGLRSRIALCLADDPAGASVVVKKDEVVKVDHGAFDTWERLEVPGPDVRSAAGRLLRADVARADGLLKGRWSEEIANRTAWTIATADMAGRRGAVVDFIRLGLDGHVDGLGLSVTEVAWCRAVLAARDRDLGVLLQSMALLPSRGYTERAALLMGTASLWLADPAHRRRVREAVGSFEGSNPEIDAIRAVVAEPTSGSACVRAARALLPGVRHYGSPLGDDLDRLISGAENRQMVKPPPGLSMPKTTALGVYLRGAGGGNVDAHAHLLGPLGLAQLDDLVDSGALTAAGVAALPTGGEDAVYLRCRVDPAGVPISQVYAARFVAEYARRLFLLGDGERLALFPKGYEDADHYRTLLDLKNSQGVGPRDALRAEARKTFDVVDGYRAQLEDDPGAMPPREVLDDPTTWSLMRNEALAGKIRPGGAVRSSHPSFTTWLELCDLQRHLFEADWTTVLERGRALVHVLDDEKLRDEALNLTAFASYVLGDLDGALAMLQEALAGQYTESLVVNASIIAAEFGSEPAAQFLAKVFDEAPTEEVKYRAVSRAIEIWLGDAASPKFPVTTARCMRSMLTAGMSDDSSFQNLVSSAGKYDRDWLAADPAIVTSTPVQRDALMLYATKAKSAAGKVGPEDWAAEVVRLNKVAEPHEWARNELTMMTRDLMSAVHCPFGEAPGLLAPIRVLADGGVLPLLEDIVLQVQGTTHVIVFLQQEKGNSIAPDIEQRYLFLPFERFKSEEAQLPADTRELVKEELDRCVTMASLSMAAVTETDIGAFAATWDSLVARERWDHQNRSQILRSRRALLEEITTTVERCGRYLERMERLPVESESGKKLAVQLRGSITGWNALLTRLRSTL